MRRTHPRYLRYTIALVGCAMFIGYSAMNALGAAKPEPRAAISAPVVTDAIKKGDRLPIVSASPPRANVLSPSTMRSSGKRPPLGCDPMFSPIVDPAHARLYRRCEA
jgi:hypothetical protein